MPKTTSFASFWAIVKKLAGRGADLDVCYVGIDQDKYVLLREEQHYKGSQACKERFVGFSWE